jgi:hypothetical protein
MIEVVNSSDKQKCSFLLFVYMLGDKNFHFLFPVLENVETKLR